MSFRQRLFGIRVAGTARTAVHFRQLFLFLFLLLVGTPVALVVDAGEDEHVEQQKETANRDGHGERSGVALVVAGGQFA